jgi:hypothetical protein
MTVRIQDPEITSGSQKVLKKKQSETCELLDLRLEALPRQQGFAKKRGVDDFGYPTSIMPMLEKLKAGCWDLTAERQAENLVKTYRRNFAPGFVHVLMDSKRIRWLGEKASRRPRVGDRIYCRM